ncbi:MAG: hypothetical protein KJ732_01065 [Candidatus Margulisbacteria bacterium]|nr:hypothetical protein [Candidatus Margulisiibacteriota bacterium]
MKKGAALILTLLIMAVSLTLAALLVKIVYNCYASANAVLVREQAFCLAEAGLEKGKVELVHNLNWYTDLPYYLADNVQWLVKYAVGEESALGNGSFKVVKEKGKNRLYAIGRKGSGVVVLKLTFSNPPFKSLAWSEL